MTDSYPENPRGVRQRVSRWSTTRRGTKTLKAAYAQAARDVKRMDPAVREAIGRSNMTRADLQQLASLHVDAQFRPDRYGDLSQRLGAEAAARSNPAPGQTRNPLRRVANRYSRWQDRRRGTKALKAAFTQAARDVKRTDPQVRWAIGRSQINKADLAALASSRMDQVFRPDGRFQNVPGQQQNGAGRQGEGIQSRDAVRQEPAPQQSEQMNQRIATLQQAILEAQQQTLTLMEENNRLQAQMRDLLEARVQQLQQENAADPSLEPAQQREGANQLETGNQQPDERTTEGEPQARTEGQAEVTEPEPQVGEPRAEGEAEVGEPRAAAEAQAGEPRTAGAAEVSEPRAEAEAEVGDDNAAPVGDGGEPQATQDGPAVGGAEPQTAPAQQDPAEGWTASSETQGDSVIRAEAQEGQQSTGELDAPAASAQGPAPTVEPQQASTDPQQPGIDPQQPGVTGQQPGPGPQQPGTNAQQPAADAPQPQEPAAAEEQPRTPSTRRELVADTPGPVTIDAELLRSAGKVSVRVDPNCQQARMVISTSDTEGPSADAVNRATLTQNSDGVLSAKAAGASNGGMTINGANGRMTIGQISGGVISTGNGIQISGYNGPISVNGVQINGNGAGLPVASPIEITAVVPPGSALSARTQSADIEANGLSAVDAQTQSGAVNVDTARNVSASTQSGSVSVGRVQDLDARTQSGHVSVGRAEGEVRARTQSGSVSVDQFAGGTARVNSMSGNARIHVVDQASNGPRIVRADSMSGNATISTSSEAVAQNLNADATSMTGRASAPPRASAAPLHQSAQGARPDHQMPGRQSPTARGPVSEK